MHALSYLQKRGHLSAVALGRKMFAGVPAMTPARFDILHVIYQNSRGRPVGDGLARMSQFMVQRRLGLTRQTVWQMVKRLVELGLLEKWPHPYNPRWISLQLTPEGLRRTRLAYGVAFTERYPVPAKDGGLEAPRHVYRIIRDDAEQLVRARKLFIGVDIPFTTRAWRQEFWGPSGAPAKIGRDVAKVFTSLAWERAAKPARGRRLRMLDVLDTMVRDARKIAHALGDQSTLIYSAPRTTLAKPKPV